MCYVINIYPNILSDNHIPYCGLSKSSLPPSKQTVHDWYECFRSGKEIDLCFSCYFLTASGL